MPNQPRNIAEAALQLQTAAAELHALSVLPEAERDESMREAIEDIGERVEQVEDSLEQLRSDFCSFRDKTNKRMKSVEAQYVVFGELSTLTEYQLADSSAAESTTTG
jgi:vacuolar-type H+-ATPase subunit I/STV1